jgi:CBS domain-containing protein
MGLWSVLVGVFLLGAATSVVKSSRKTEPATVTEAMSPPISIEPDLPMNRFVDEILPLHRQTSFPVAHNRRLLGILSLEDLKKVPRYTWRERQAHDVMRTINSQLFVPDNATMGRASELMQRNGVGAVAVVNAKGELVGFLQQGQLKRRKK